MDSSGRLWPRAELRVGDADRQGVVVELKRHFADGRLTGDEVAERTTQALNARTFGELAVPLADLPVVKGSAALQPVDAATDDRSRGSAFAPALGALLVAVGVLALLWMFVFPTWHMGGLPFWPVLVLGFFFIGRSRRSNRRDRWDRGGPPTRYL